MSSDVTEDFQVDISLPVGATPVALNTNLRYDFAFGSEMFFDASTSERPYRRQTAPYQKDQNDNSGDPGEQTLAGWWLRSQSSFHYGAGADFYEPSQDQNLKFRFDTSEGVNVWRAGQVTLLPDTYSTHAVVGSARTFMRPVEWSGVNGSLLLDNGDVDKLFPTRTFSINNKALTSNVATLTTTVAHNLLVGMEVDVTGVDATFNGTYKITAVTSNTFSYAKTASNVSSTAVSPVGTASSNVVHFIDHTTGSDTNVYAICDDGTRAFWVTNQYSTGKCQIFTKNLDKTSSDTNTSMYYDNGIAVTSAAIEYVKGRLIACINNVIYELDPASVGSTNLPTSTTGPAAPAFGKTLFTNSNTNYTYTSITESPSNIYISGYVGGSSQIIKLTVSDSGGIASLVGAVAVAEMPRGEIIYTIQYYLGYLLIGTSKGVRIAAVQTDGSIVYGPILGEFSQPVYGFACSDKYVWATDRIGGDSGLVRFDLGNPYGTLQFPWAYDLQALNIGKQTTGVSFMGNTDILGFSAATSSVYMQHPTRLRESGFITTGRIRFATIENKYFKYVKPRADLQGGSLGVSVDDTFITTTNVANQDLSVPGGAFQIRQFTFTLNRSSTDNTQGPVFWGYQVKALPAVAKQRLIQYNLYCFDMEQDSYGNRVGSKGRAYRRVQAFENVESTSDIITIRDFRTDETFQGLIEECSFRSEVSRSKTFSGFGGILTVTVRKVS